MQQQVPLSDKIGQVYEKMLDGKILENLYNQQNDEQKLNMIYNFLKTSQEERSDLMVRMLQGHFTIKVLEFNNIFKNENKQQLMDVMLKNIKLTTFNYKQTIFQQDNPIQEININLSGNCISLQKVDKQTLKQINKKSKLSDQEICEQIFDQNQKACFQYKIKTYLILNDLILRYRLPQFNITHFLRNIQSDQLLFDENMLIFRILLNYSDHIYVRNIQQYDILGELQLSKNCDKNYNHTIICINECKFGSISQSVFHKAIHENFLGSYKQQLVYLNQSYLFKIISPEIQLQLAMLSKQKNLYKNEIIYKQEDQNEYIYFIMNGEIHLQALVKDQNADKKSNILKNLNINKVDKTDVFKNVGVLGKGQVFGDEILISDNDIKINQAKCNNDSLVLILTKNQIQSYINSSQQVQQIHDVVNQKIELRNKKMTDIKKIQKQMKTHKVAQRITFDVNNAWEQKIDVQIVEKKEIQNNKQSTEGPKLPLIQNSFYKKYTDDVQNKLESQLIINNQKLQYNKLKELINKEDVEIQEKSLNNQLKLKVQTSRKNEQSLDLENRHLTARYQGCFFKSISEIGRASFYLKNQLIKNQINYSLNNEFIVNVNKQLQNESHQQMTMNKFQTKSQDIKIQTIQLKEDRCKNRIVLYKQKLKRNQSILNNQI